MSETANQLNQRIQQSIADGAEDNHEDTIDCRLASQLRDSRSQLQQLSEQFPDSKEPKGRIEKMEGATSEIVGAGGLITLKDIRDAASTAANTTSNPEKEPANDG